MTWIGPVSDSAADSGIGPGENEILAFDTGPGNALMDDWAGRAMGRPYDTFGALAAKGKVDKEVLSRLLDHPFFRPQAAQIP